MNVGEEEVIIDNSLSQLNHGKSFKTTSTSSTTSKNPGKEKSSYHSHGKDRKKNSKRSREEEKTKSDKKKSKKSNLTPFESECHGFDGIGQGGESLRASDQLSPLQGQVGVNPIDCLTEACMKYELLRENYQNLRHSYLHLKRRYDERDLEMQMNRRKLPGVKEIQELEGVVDPLTSPVTVSEIEKDTDGATWKLTFLESDSKTWKVRWERIL